MKLCAKGNNKVHVIAIVNTFSEYMTVEFVIDNCAKVHFK